MPLPRGKSLQPLSYFRALCYFLCNGSQHFESKITECFRKVLVLSLLFLFRQPITWWLISGGERFSGYCCHRNKTGVPYFFVIFLDEASTFLPKKRLYGHMPEELPSALSVLFCQNKKLGGQTL